MNWKHIAKEELLSYTKLRTALQNLHDRIATLEERKAAIRISTVTPVPMHGGGSQYEDRLLDTIVELDSLRGELTFTTATVKQIERGLEALSSNERLILDKFYINRTANYIEELCDKLAVERPTVYRAADRALRAYTIAKYGAGNLMI